MRKKVLGTSVDYRDVVNFNIKLIVEYSTTANEKVKKEAIFSIQTTDKETAERLAIEKAKKQLEGFPYWALSLFQSVYAKWKGEALK